MKEHEGRGGAGGKAHKRRVGMDGRKDTLITDPFTEWLPDRLADCLTD